MLDHVSSAHSLPNNKRLLIIHPEGNINNNPNLSGIVQILCEQGYRIDYCAFHKNIPQEPPCDGVRMRLYASNGRTEIDGFVMLDSHILESSEKVKSYINHTLPKYSLIIGIDRGIIEANLISLHQQVPCGLIPMRYYSARRPVGY